MYDYISGKVSKLTPTHIVLDVNGVGYYIHISVNTHSQLNAATSAKLYTHMYLREDAMELFGFYSEQERTIFRQLISVSGVGTNTARLILSSLSPEEVRHSILAENVAQFKSVKGIGLKTAQRIILDLKDKVLKDIGDDEAVSSGSAVEHNEEAYNALLSLGFQSHKIRKALQQIAASGDRPQDTERLVKSALKIMT